MSLAFGWSEMVANGAICLLQCTIDLHESMQPTMHAIKIAAYLVYAYACTLYCVHTERICAKKLVCSACWSARTNYSPACRMNVWLSIELITLFTNSVQTREFCLIIDAQTAEASKTALMNSLGLSFGRQDGYQYRKYD